jgi:hypothetical protein
MVSKEPFRLPVEYVDPALKHEIASTVACDLELTPRPAAAGGSYVYNTLFTPRHLLAQQTAKQWARCFTSDVTFLKETQMLVQTPPVLELRPHEPARIQRIVQHWNRLVDADTDFLQRYGYMELEWFQSLNHSATYLQTIATVQLTSPLLTLLLPIMILFFPLLLLHAQGVSVSFATYMETLKIIAKNHVLGKLLNIQEYNFQNIGYIFTSLVMYAYSLYSNTIVCKHFYENIVEANGHLMDLKNYLDATLSHMRDFTGRHAGLATYKVFLAKTRDHLRVLEQYQEKLRTLTPFTLSFAKLNKIGELLTLYYTLYNDKKLQESIEYSFGFEGYLDNIDQVYHRGVAATVAWARWTDEAAAAGFEGQTYPLLEGGAAAPVKNDVALDKNMIITGPNASGKTTLLKTTLINIILSQQCGCGFYTAATIAPYTHIHSYLNIPDTSGRDSLFQAESRRCKEILDAVEPAEPKSRHFCIFDELYSGTNYREATRAARSFLEYLSRRDNVTFMLTTHYRKLCKHKNERIVNCKMDVVRAGDRLEYTYVLKPGVSKIEGGIVVMKDLNYPEEIITMMEDPRRPMAGGGGN